MAFTTTARNFLTGLLLCALSACSSLPQSGAPLQAVTVTHLDGGLIQIDYQGNVARERAERVDLTLLRAAETALQLGYHYFIVIDPDTPLPGTDSSRPVSLQATTFYNGQRYALTEPDLRTTIIGFRQKPRGFAYVALFVKASLRASYGLDRSDSAI